MFSNERQSPTWECVMMGLTVVLAVSAFMTLSVPASAADSQGEEGVVRARVTAYWSARIQRSDTVWDYYAPTELGGAKDRRRVAETGNMRFKEYQIELLELKDDTAHVRMKVDATYPVGGGNDEGRRWLTFEEYWSKACGTWYRKPVRRGIGRKNFRANELGPPPTPESCATYSAKQEAAEEELFASDDGALVSVTKPAEVR